MLIKLKNETPIDTYKKLNKGEINIKFWFAQMHEWGVIANEPAERRRSAGEAAENSAARRMLYAEKFSNDV